ncbi:MAG: ATP-binding cassette domain-containing protein [Tabrizicola sp.]|nr:ATP-binding cassette domain-containing protein [Tabrizicola sp.]
MVLTVSEVSKSYPSAEGRVAVLSGVSLALGPGESLALTGESGSGKSTLLHLVAGLDLVDAGEIVVGGTRLAGLEDAARAALRRDRIGLVFQQFNLIPSLTAGANLAFQARLAGRHDPAWCAHLAGAMGLSGLMHRYPDQLSVRPPLILADEPTGNLDEAAGEAVMGLMLDLVAETGAALLMVTHSDRLAQRLDRRLHLQGGRVA